MLIWVGLLLFLLTGSIAEAAKPDPPETITTIGLKKLATVADCSQPIAFSGTRAVVQEGRLVFSETLLDRGVGYSGSNGVFTTHCPGLYQFSFAGPSELRLSLKRRLASTGSWTPLVTGPGHLVLLRMALGDQLAVFLEAGKPSDDASVSFSGYRIAKE